MKLCFTIVYKKLTMMYSYINIKVQDTSCIALLMLYVELFYIYYIWQIFAKLVLTKFLMICGIVNVE